MDNTTEITYKTKHTKVGDIPKDWNLEKLRKNAIVLFSNVDKHVLENEIPVLLCNYQDVYYHDYILSSIPFSAGSAKPSEFHKFKLHKGDVIITKDSEDRKDIAVPAYVIEEIPNLVCGYHLAIIRPNESHLEGIFLSQLLQSHNVNHYFQKLANGVTRFGLTTDSIKNALIPIPPLLEQQKIAEILSTWDLAISTTQSLINELKHRNKGLAQQLLTGKKRLKRFEGEWNVVPLGELFEEIKESNDGADSHHVMTISSTLGLITQESKFDRIIAGDSLKKYTLLQKGDFAYNKGNSKIYPMGCIYRLQEDSALVPFVYICFRHREKISSDFYSFWFLDHGLDRQLKKIITSGARGDGLLNVGKKDFFKLIVPYPSKDEQMSIASVLSEANKELKLYQKQLEALKEQKKGLMQKLLTGEVRVKI